MTIVLPITLNNSLVTVSKTTTSFIFIPSHFRSSAHIFQSVLNLSYTPHTTYCLGLVTDQECLDSPGDV